LFIELHQWQPGVPRFHEALAWLADAGFDYRIHSAVAHGAAPRPSGLAALNYPANLVNLYAWRASPV
jgi:hypothetical protein